MYERGKIINALEKAKYEIKELGIGDEYVQMSVSVTESVIELLKEQDPKQIINRKQLNPVFITVGQCPCCKRELNSDMYPVACGFCGQAVKW